MTADLATIGTHKVKNVQSGETVELKTLWQNQDVAVIFFRRWGCMFCRLWGKELSEIAPVLKKHDVKLVGVGLEEAGSKEFVDGKYFDGDLYYVEDPTTYQTLGFKKFNVVSILSSLLWKQSRDAISKGRGMGLGGDLKGDWGQTGGALLVGKGGRLLTQFVQTGPAEHLPNLDILKHFGLEAEFKPETMTNQKRDDNAECTFPVLMMMWAVSKIVHHSSPCCSHNVDRYFCLPLGRDPSETRRSNVHINPIGLEWVDNDAMKKYSHHSEHDKELTEVGSDSSMEREDPAVQMIPAEHVNTDNEIVVISGNENENEDFLAGMGAGVSGGSEEVIYPQKYDFMI